MNEIIDFLKHNNHCTKLFGCTTCGGILGFNADLDRWIKTTSPDLLKLIKLISPLDLYSINDWQIFLEQILNRIHTINYSPSLFSFWRGNFGINIEYDLFALKFAQPGAFDFISDEHWIKKDLEYITKNKMGLKIKPLIDYIGPNLFLFPDLEMYQLFLQNKQVEEELARKLRIIRNQKEKIQKTIIMDNERRVTENKLLEINGQFSSQPITRLLTTFDDSSISLFSIPKEWANIPDEFIVNLSSSEITYLIKQLTNRLSKNEKSCWKSLRSKLFLIRQAVYNNEMGYPKSVKSFEKSQLD